MANFKEQFSEIRKNTPRHIQWLLLAAAFVVVLILMTLLIGGRKKSDVPDTPAVAPRLIIKNGTGADAAPWTDQPIDWQNVIVGQKREQTLTLTATAPVRILQISTDKKINGFKTLSACHRMGQIDTTVSCTLTMEYAPTVAMSPETVTISINWLAASDPDDKMQEKKQISVLLGANAPVVPQPVPEPVPESEPDPILEPEFDAEPEPMPEPEPDPAPSPRQEKIKDEIKAIAPVAIPEPDDTYTIPAEACSDFAFPGYDAGGNQIGWIRPDAGGYFFHPFSDRNCDNPTGIYNPDNGIISDIDNAGKKIGTDAEHIGTAAVGAGATLPQLSNPAGQRTENRAQQLSADQIAAAIPAQGPLRIELQPSAIKPETFLGSAADGDKVVASMPYDRKFILRQYKPIPATIVSEILADRASLEQGLPVRATVDRNVYSDDGRTVIIPTGTLMLGFVTGDIPGPYKAIGRMDIKWYQFILPNGVEFNFRGGQEPFSADSQGRSGVPGRGSTDYMEQFLMPMLTAIVPAAVNLIAPVSDAFINQIDLDNNTVVQSGTVRSSELAKNEIITAWNQVSQKLLVDMMDNTVPPFSIAAGTRITVYSPADLIVTCGENTGKECSIAPYDKNKRRSWNEFRGDGAGRTYNYNDASYVGQVRSFNWQEYCTSDGKVDQSKVQDIYAKGLSYNNVLFYCQSNQYQAINNAKQDALYQNQQQQFTGSYGTQIDQTKKQQEAYNQEVLGLKYDDKGAIINPFQDQPTEQAPAANVLTCLDGTLPDMNGCCTGEIYTDMGEQGFNCCPETGGDCFPPMK